MQHQTLKCVTLNVSAVYTYASLQTNLEQGMNVVFL